MARKPLIAGNWKMNLNHLEAIALVQKIAFSLPAKYFDKVDVTVIPPFTDIRTVQTLLDADIVTDDMLLERHDIYTILVPGTRVCFTGTAQDTTGRVVERDEMERLAISAGLTPVKTVSKTRCDVLVTAEQGTQSGKARKAGEYNKPVVCADEFFAWLAAR